MKTGIMQRKVLFGYDYTDKEWVKLLLYLFVGGTAALVEWSIFYVLLHFVLFQLPLSLPTAALIGTSLAYCFSTLYHYFLGNILVFNSGVRFGKGKELSLVFLVSLLGLGFNLAFMYIFVGLLNWNPMISKVITSFLCVAWNYLARKYFIFKE